MKLSKEHFSAKDTFECGQCFRWEKVNDDYIGVVGSALLKVCEESTHYEVSVIAGELDVDLAHYFDETADYEAIKTTLRDKDVYLSEAVQLGKGIRLLNQAPFELLISFIISSNNNIPKIKMAVEALSSSFGQYIGSYEGKAYYRFPTLEELLKVDLEQLKVKGMGYRNVAVYKTVEKLVADQIDLCNVFGMDYDQGKQFLKTFYGVGDKVADCVLLFAFEKKNAFPIDTWVKRILRELYHIEDSKKAYQTFVNSYFTEFAGYAQQYLFYYMRLKSE